MNRNTHIIVNFCIAAAAVAWPAQAEAQAPQLFVTSDRCVACHNQLVTPSGTDVSIGTDWQSSMMAHSSRDPYWQGSVRREIMAHPSASAAIQHECSACHMPMSRYHAKVTGGSGQVFAHLPVGRRQSLLGLLAADGVSCAMCHQIQAENLGQESSFTAGFVVDTATPPGRRPAFGPFEVTEGRKTLMQSAARFLPEQSDHVQQSELCATCHTLYTHALDDRGEVIGELPEQVPYLEWKHSDYYIERSCQSCHMPVVEDQVPVTVVLGEPRDEVSRHVFRGGNFFMPRIMNRHRGELGVAAGPQMLEVTSRRTAEHLETSSAVIRLEGVVLDGPTLSADVVVENLAGHKLPSAYPSRRAWISLAVFDRAGGLVFSSGGLRPDGSIAGNDNDAVPDLYEPHYTEVTDSGQVQIYEGILAGPDDRVTTVLLTATQYIKDNRILPSGFEKKTAHPDIAVRGGAAGDPDFTGGTDRVRYSVDVGDAGGPFSITAELWYQPIAFRWAHNLSDQTAPETDRFVASYEEMSGTSGIVLARTSATAE